MNEHTTTIYYCNEETGAEFEIPVIVRFTYEAATKGGLHEPQEKSRVEITSVIWGTDGITEIWLDENDIENLEEEINNGRQ